MKKLFRWLFILLGGGVLLNGIVLSFTSNFNIGNILTLLLGAGVLLATIFIRRVLKIPKLILGALSLVLVFFLGLSVFLICFGSADTVDYKEDAVIVLGAAVHGEKPSLALRRRLDKAAEYHKKNPYALIIVSGGQGPQEDISEAEAMEKYLLSKGVDPDMIIKEDRSTSTEENFKFSKEILDTLFPEGFSVGYISNDYHIYRAGLIASRAGIENATHLHSSTIWHSVLPGTLRETGAVLYSWVAG